MPPPLRRRGAGPGSIWATIEIATSAGDIAPMVKPDGRVNAGEVVVAETQFLEPRAARRMGAARAERADIEAVRAQRRGQRRVVELWVMGQGHDRRARGRAAAVRAPRRAIPGQLDPRETRLGGEGIARVDNCHRVVDHRQHLHQRLRDVHRAYDKAAPRRGEHLDEDRAPPEVSMRAVAAGAPRFAQGAERRVVECQIAFGGGAVEQQLPAGRRGRWRELPSGARAAAATTRSRMRPFIRRARQRSGSCRRRRGRLPRPGRW